VLFILQNTLPLIFYAFILTSSHMNVKAISKIFFQPPIERRIISRGFINENATALSRAWREGRLYRM